MKTLSDNTQVSSKSYYFLLDWNEQNEKKFIFETFNKHRLCDLTINEYCVLWNHATTEEYEYLKLKL